MFLIPNSNHAAITETFHSDVIIIYKDSDHKLKFYKNQIRPNTSLPIYSLSKMYLNLFIGHLEKLSIINTRESIFPNSHQLWETKLNVESLMRMESGYRCIDDYEGFEKIKAGIISPIKPSDSHLQRFIQKCLPLYSPDTTYHYSFFDYNLLILHLIDKLGESQFKRLFSQFLNEKLNLKNTYFNINIPKDRFLPNSYSVPPSILWMNSSSEDLIKTAQFFLKEKNSNLIQIDWFKRTTSYNLNLFPLKPDLKDFYKQFTYGMLWFLNKPFMNQKKPYEKLPKDVFFIHGLKGQIIAVFPSERAIFLRLANDPMTNHFSREEILNYNYQKFIKN